MAKQVLTEKTLKKLAKRPAKSGKRYDTMDALVPGFGVRVTDKGHLTYIPAGRSPGSKSYTRREIGEVGACTLSPAREKARAWIEWIKAGKDPSAEMERAKREQARISRRTLSKAWLRPSSPNGW